MVEFLAGTGEAGEVKAHESKRDKGKLHGKKLEQRIYKVGT